MKTLNRIIYLLIALLMFSCKENSTTIAIDGTESIDGLTIIFKGESLTAPENPLINWVYKNSTTQKVFIFNGVDWTLLVSDGSDGTIGTKSSNNVSVFISYNNNPITNPPLTPTGNGTLPVGWHTDSTNEIVWVSQKVSSNPDSGIWGDPILIKNNNSSNGGFVYSDGFKPDLKCASCHNPDGVGTIYAIAAKRMEYELSGHYLFGNAEMNTTQCAGCHTNEGFYERVKNGISNEIFTPGIISGPKTFQSYSVSTPVGCFTCHIPHGQGDFTVRDSSAVKIFSMISGQTTKIPVTTASSSMCIKCHQPRMTSTFLIPGSVPVSWQPDPTKTAVTDTAKIFTTRWNNHGSGEMTQSLFGFGGFEFIGYTYSNSVHTTLFTSKSIGCESCHMGTPIGNSNGGHTFKIGYKPTGSITTSYNLTGCNTSDCHNGQVNPTSSLNTHWGAPRAEISAKIGQLGRLLADTNITKKYSLRKNGKAVAWASLTVSGSDTVWSVVNASTTSPLIIIPASKAGALWNLQFIQFEKSKGIHNLAYTRALLDASIAELSK